MTIHDFDMVRYLANSEGYRGYRLRCSALSGAGYEEYGDVDTAIVMMKFENGALGVIDNSRMPHTTATTSAPRFTATRAACRLQTI